MKKNEIQVGGRYTCKVSDRIAVVEVTGENPHGGWDAKNLTTGKAVRIKSAQRLRSARFVDETALRSEAEKPADKPATKPTSKGKAKAAEPKAEAQAAEGVDAAAGVAGETGAPANAPDARGKKMGLVAAAIQVLKDGGNQPMGCQEMLEQVTAKGLWSPARGGKTPAASLYAAVLREIRDKAAASRFTKTDRGRFALNTKLES